MNSKIQKPKWINQKIYRTIFWLGYVMVFAAAFVPLKNDLHEITFNIISIKFHFDQILHAVVYLLICLYFPSGQYFGLKLFKGNSFKKFLLVILVLATVTEVFQLIVPSRAFNFFDILANDIGIAVGLLIIRITGLRVEEKSE
jgi:VanZ family protein